MLGFVIGDRNMVMGFRLVGVEGREVDSVDMARQTVEETLANNEVAVILLSQQFSEQLREYIDTIRTERVSPLILEIPGSIGPQKEMRISDLVKQKIGIKF